MRENALANRIKAIERAAGQHAVVKMRLFARVLCLESLDDLAHDANEALQVRAVHSIIHPWPQGV
jgi:hypothetical protein